MSAALVLEELKHLSNVERLAVIEAATRLIREDVLTQHCAASEEQATRLRSAAASLADYYAHDSDVAAWTGLDAEDVLDDTVPR